MGGISIWQLLIILVIVMLLFGTKKLRNIGTDLGGAVKGFRSAVKQGSDESAEEAAKLERDDENVIEDKVTDTSKEEVAAAPKEEAAAASGRERVPS